VRLEGQMEGVYEDVFETSLLDLTEISASGVIEPNGHIQVLTLSAYGIYGKGYCYKDLSILTTLETETEEAHATLEALSTSGEPLIDESFCVSANLIFSADLLNYTYNYYTGILPFENV